MTSQVENLRQTYVRTYDNFMTNRKIFFGNLAAGFFHCASVYVVIGCDAVSVSSQLDKYNDQMQADGTLSVNAFEFWHARGPSGVVCLAEHLTCAAASQDRVQCIFLSELLYSER